MTRIKICGLLRVEDALVAAEAGADLLGFVFAESRRRIEPDAAREIVAEVKRQFPVQVAGVFVNTPVTAMNEIADFCGLDYLQLSGDEDAATVQAASRPVIKAIHVAPGASAGTLAGRAAAIDAEVIMLDTGGRGAYGGTGQAFDWGLAPALGRPVLLAGGLSAANVGAAIQRVRPWGVDVSSGVETEGAKDQGKIRAFVRAARAASP